MSYSESYNQCMAPEGTSACWRRHPLQHVGLSEPLEVFEDSSGDRGIRRSRGHPRRACGRGLAAGGPRRALEVIDFVALAGANIAAHMYALRGGELLAKAVVTGLLFSELMMLPRAAPSRTSSRPSAESRGRRVEATRARAGHVRASGRTHVARALV